MIDKKQGKFFLGALIERAYKYDEGFYFYYRSDVSEKRGYINTNDLGDYIPYIDYYGFDDIVVNWVSAVLNKYDLFYKEPINRFGSTRLSLYGFIDLYSNSDFYHGLLYVRKLDKYKELHGRIDLLFERLIKRLSKTNYTNFYKLFKWYLSVPIFRPIDIGMFPELLVEYGDNKLANKILRYSVDKILRQNELLSKSYFLCFKLQKDCVLMKDHTNLLFSYIRFYRSNRELFKPKELKSILKMVISCFARGNVIFNAKSEYKNADSLVFSILEIFLEAYVLTDDNFYLECLKKYMPFWIELIESLKVLPTKIDPKTLDSSNISIVDTNTDFYTFLSKANLFLGESFVPNSLIENYKKNIIEMFVDKENLNIYTTLTMNEYKRNNVIKSKFSALFSKVFILNDISSQSEYSKMEVYLDDR